MDATTVEMADIKVQVGQQIREARKTKGLTQKELGLMVGVGEPTIANYESGKQNLTLETMQKVAAALKMDFGVFFK